MPPSALALVVLAGLIHASWNIFAALIGGQLLGEGDRALRIAGAALIAAGVMALAIG